MNVRQLTTEEAIEFVKSNVWMDWTHTQRFLFQMHQRKLCIPFSMIQESTEETLGRPVWTHEFACPDKLLEEYLGMRESLDVEETMKELEKWFSQDRLIVVVR